MWHEPDEETLSRLIAAFGLPSDPTEADEALAEEGRPAPFGLSPVHIVAQEEPAPAQMLRQLTELTNRSPHIASWAAAAETEATVVAPTPAKAKAATTTPSKPAASATATTATTGSAAAAKPERRARTRKAVDVASPTDQA